MDFQKILSKPSLYGFVNYHCTVLENGAGQADFVHDWADANIEY